MPAQWHGGHRKRYQMQRPLGLILFLLLVALPVAAIAQAAPDPEALKRRSQEALELAQEGKMAQAIVAWEDVLAVAEGELALNIHFNLAAAYEHSGDTVNAWHHLGSFIRSNPKDDPEARQELERLEKELSKKLVKLGIACTVPEATIYLGKEPMGTPFRCPLTWWFEPGSQAVVVSAEGHESKVEEFVVRKLGGEASHLVVLEKKKVTIEAGKTLVERPPDAQPEVAVVEPPDRGDDGNLPAAVSKGDDGGKSGSSLWPWTVVGAGGAMVIAGAVFHGLSFANENDLFDRYPDKRYQAEYDKAYENEVAPKIAAAYVLYGVGAAAAAGGVVWALLSSGSEDDVRLRTTVAPMWVPGGQGLSFSVSF
jgi:hypothetical protein